MGKLTFSVHHNGSHGFKNGPKLFPHTYEQHIFYGGCLGSWSRGPQKDTPQPLLLVAPIQGSRLPGFDECVQGLVLALY